MPAKSHVHKEHELAPLIIIYAKTKPNLKSRYFPLYPICKNESEAYTIHQYLPYFLPIMRLLVVEDHPKIRANIRTFLKIAGFESDEAVTGVEALEKFQSHPYDAVILDINLPLMNGREFLSHIRSDGSAVPVLALTSDSLLRDKVEVLDLGADDYLTKPFESEELIARVRAILRRREKTIEDKEIVGDLAINFPKMQVHRDGTVVELSAKEWGVLEYLLHNRGAPKNKSEILQSVWGEQEEALDLDSLTLEMHISSLRKKLGKDLIRTIRNVGYVID